MIYLYPTDTVYGLGVDARDAEAVRALRVLKGSGGEKHYSIAVSGLEMMREYAEVTPLAERLVQKFLPGKLTIILKAKNLPHELSDDGTIGVRVPDHPVVRELIKKIGGPITATSANVSGQSTQKTVPDILSQFGDRAGEIYFDPAWPSTLPESLPSTVVDARGESLVLIREGAVPWSDLQGV
ncbi:threonylcarbamoyl-AMP synthase [Patescibacteria group bacterium]|nr:threonylcarbamoyl-AMP synthase [Patescibacteria group bacterium]